MKGVVWLLSFGLALGVTLNVIHGDVLRWEGFFFGLLGAVFGIVFYVKQRGGDPLRAVRRFAKRFAKPS